MATYCTADIHGQLDVFEKLLKDINLKKADTLYVLGDVIDRGPCGIDILKIIMETDNIKMIMGNHEQMCLDYLGPRGSYMAKGLWFNNGGQETYWDLQRNIFDRSEEPLKVALNAKICYAFKVRADFSRIESTFCRVKQEKSLEFTQDEWAKAKNHRCNKKNTDDFSNIYPCDFGIFSAESRSVYDG